MSDKALAEDRRAHPRYKSKDCLFAANSKFGQVIDISLGGLAFYYVDRKEWATEVFDRGVLFGEDDLWLDNIPVKTVSDYVVTDNFPTGAMTVRRRSVQFGSLSDEQKSQLAYFIAMNTKGQQGFSFSPFSEQ